LRIAQVRLSLPGVEVALYAVTQFGLPLSLREVPQLEDPGLQALGRHGVSEAIGHELGDLGTGEVREIAS
jgi:hypothetical protein